MADSSYWQLANLHQKQALQRVKWPLIVVSFLLLGLACTPEDERLTSQEAVTLTFSRDTVQFDTVFATVGSTTQRLQVYNPQRNAVNITSIALGAGENGVSPYRLVVNGEPGTQFQDVFLRGGDSLLVLVEVTLDPQNTDLPFIVKDSIVFRANGSVQDVNLEAWGQDAYFLKSGVVVENVTFTAQRPYVICDSLWVLPSATLTLAAGARLYFNNRARLLVGGTLRAEGTVDAPVLFQHIRNDGAYENAPGQWQGISFGPESKENRLEFAVIRNATTGVFINSPDNDTIPDITLANTTIENMDGYGVLSLNSDIDAYNTLIDNCALGLVHSFGAAYNRWIHCTLVNENTSFSRDELQPALRFDDTLASPDLSQGYRVEIVNSIIWGDFDNELFIIPRRAGFEREVAYNLIKSADTTLVPNLFNKLPELVDPPLYNYRLDSLSPAIDAGVTLGIEKDLAGNLRDAHPDLGAYEYVK